MKFVIVSLFILVSSVSFADGLRCEGQGYKVQMYNHTDPSRGTRTPAVLIVSQDGVGTVAVVAEGDLVTYSTATELVYEGQVNGSQDGRFTHAVLKVSREGRSNGTYGETAEGKLVLTANRDTVVADLDCDHYRKSDNN